jgi:hypothetical protein
LFAANFRTHGFPVRKSVAWKTSHSSVNRLSILYGSSAGSCLMSDAIWVSLRALLRIFVRREDFTRHPLRRGDCTIMAGRRTTGPRSHISALLRVSRNMEAALVLHQHDSPSVEPITATPADRAPTDFRNPQPLCARSAPANAPGSPRPASPVGQTLGRTPTARGNAARHRPSVPH